jgi:hypothetical protein
MFFFEKKNQKTFVRAVADLSGKRATADQKFFASFFQKRRPSFSKHEHFTWRPTSPGRIVPLAWACRAMRPMLLRQNTERRNEP